MTRQLELATLEGAAEHYAAFFLLPDRRNASDTRWVSGPSYVIQDFMNFDFKDEFDAMRQMIESYMGSASLKKFAELADKHFTPRSDEVFHETLKRKLAVTPDGDHMEGFKGTTIVGSRHLGKHMVEVATPGWLAYRRECLDNGWPVPPRQTHLRLRNWRWPVYAGEDEERERIKYGERKDVEEGLSIIDTLPIGGETMANVPNFSAEAVIAALNGLGNSVDEGTAAGYVQGRTGAQPADPDVATTGILLFSCEGSDPFFPTAVDDADGSVSKTASAISDDVSADATNTLGYCRISAANTSITELDNHIDGEAGTSGADFNFNTLSIVSGSTVSITSLVLGQSQGSTAT